MPRLGLTLIERVVYAHLVRHSRLAGKRQFRFSILLLARNVRVSDLPTRNAVRSLAAKGALRLVDHTQSGHLAEVLLPDEMLCRRRELCPLASGGGPAAPILKRWIFCR